MSTAFKLRNGTILLSTEAPGGIYNAAQLKKIASLCEGDSVIVRATEDQRLALCVKPESAAEVAEQLKAIGLGIRHYQDGLHHPTSCIGELCPDFEQDALGTALDLSQELSQITLANPLKIGVNGCAKCCVPCHTLDVSVIGDASGYRVNLGGKNSQLPEMATFMAEGVPAAELPKLIKTVVELYQQNATTDETLQDVLERVGTSQFISALAPYSQDAAASGDPFGASSEESIDPSTIESTEDDLPALEAPIAEDFQDISAAPDELDINPQSDRGTSDDIGGEVEISTASDSIPEISLTDDFGEDSLDLEASPTETSSIESMDLETHSSDIPDIAATEDLSLESLDLNGSELKLAEAEIDLSESQIDVSDVLVGNKTTPAEVNTESLEAVDLAVAGQVELDGSMPEEDENAYEQKLSESIAETESMQTFVQEDETRNETLGILDSAEVSLEEAPLEEVSLEEAPQDLAEAEMPEEETSHQDLTEDTIHELPLSEMVASTQKHNLTALGEEDFEAEVSIDVSETKEPQSKPTPISSKRTWAFSGIDIDADGQPVIAFGNGVQITLSRDAVSSGALTIGGHTIHVKEVKGGLEVHIDGMKMFLPAAA